MPVEIGMPGYLAGTFSDPVLLASQAEEAQRLASEAQQQVAEGAAMAAAQAAVEAAQAEF